MRGHEVTHPAIERHLSAVDRIAVVIAGNGKNRRRVVIVGIVELVVVHLDLAVVVNHVAQMVEKIGRRAGGLVQVPFHRAGHGGLVIAVLDSSSFADAVENNLAAFLRSGPNARNRRLEIVVVRRLPQGGGKRLKALRSMSEWRDRLNAGMGLRSALGWSRTYLSGMQSSECYRV